MGLLTVTLSRRAPPGQGRMIRSRIRPMTSHTTAARPQLTRAFLVAALSPVNSRTPSLRSKTPRSTASAASLTNDDERVVGVGLQRHQQGAEREDQGAQHAHQPHELGDAGPYGVRRGAGLPLLRRLDGVVLGHGSVLPVHVTCGHAGVRVMGVSGGRGLAGWADGRCAGHRPTNCALPGPCSTNDCMPMARSSVAKSAANCWRSISRPVSRSTSRPRSMASLAARTAYDAALLNCAAHATASS